MEVLGPPLGPRQEFQLPKLGMHLVNRLGWERRAGLSYFGASSGPQLLLAEPIASTAQEARVPEELRAQVCKQSVEDRLMAPITDG